MSEARPHHPLADVLVQLSRDAAVEPPAQALLTPDRGPRAYLAALVGADHLPDAIRIVARLLPSREGVWWAWVAVRRACDGSLTDPGRAALKATEEWIANPSDAHRRAAYAAAEEAGFDTPAGAVALGVYFTGGSIAPPEAPAVEPPSGTAARILAGSVLMGTTQTDPALAPERMRDALRLAVDVAERIRLWPPEPDAASPSPP